MSSPQLPLFLLLLAGAALVALGVLVVGLTVAVLVMRRSRPAEVSETRFIFADDEPDQTGQTELLRGIGDDGTDAHTVMEEDLPALLVAARKKR